MGFAEHLVEGKAGALTSTQKEYLQDIFKSGKHLLGLIDDVLDLGMVESGKMRIIPEKFSLRAAVEKVCLGVRTVARKHGIHVDAVVSPELGEVTLDPQKFRQILYNLLSNAIKFTKGGGIVRIRVQPQGAHHLRLAVKDTGIGIKAEDLPRLFRDFEQLDSGPSRRYEGSGLGLALTKKIIELQGGTISVESQYGVGTSFLVVLPKTSNLSPQAPLDQSERAEP